MPIHKVNGIPINVGCWTRDGVTKGVKVMRIKRPTAILQKVQYDLGRMCHYVWLKDISCKVIDIK